jgi:hypothetical protein
MTLHELKIESVRLAIALHGQYADAATILKTAADIFSFISGGLPAT